MSNYIRPELDDLPSSPTNSTLSNDASFFTIREWPILIGAVVGAIGLVLIIITSILIWFCCQYANNSNNTYRLSEDDSDSCHNYDANKTGLNEQRNFSRIDRVLLLRPSEINLCRDTSRSLSSNLSSNFANYTTNHLPINYQIGKSTAASLLNPRQSDVQNNDMIDIRYLNAQSVNLC